MSLDIIATNPIAARKAVEAAWVMGKALTAEGRKFHILAEEAEDDRTILQNRFYWGPCLKEISEQATIEGQRWAPEAWHELGKRMFLGYEIKKVRVAGRKKTTVIRRLKSTTGLSVRKFSVYLEKLQAFAATDLGVHFSVRNWEEYRP